MEDNYTKYRGKCKEFCEEAIKNDPTLTLVRGHYHCPVWNTREPHWWCVRNDGAIFDPTCLQFPSEGSGFYEPYNGMITCEVCDKEVKEEDGCIYHNHTYCSEKCLRWDIGV